MLLLLETIKLWVATVQKLFSAKILPFYIHIQINSTDQKSHYNRNSVTYCSRVNYFFDIFPLHFGEILCLFSVDLIIKIFFVFPIHTFQNVLQIRHTYVYFFFVVQRANFIAQKFIIISIWSCQINARLKDIKSLIIVR